jgi:single-stranded-DNA-specific exonuclease
VTAAGRPSVVTSTALGIVDSGMSTPSITNKTRWAVNACSWQDATRLSQELGIPQVVGMVLAGRGLCDPAAAREFLECSGPLPDPFLFADMRGAVGAILAKVDQGRRIVVHGDYDADGITATALLVQGLRGLGADVDWYLPSRFHEGYGLSRTAVEAIVADKVSMLITVDCGVNYPDEVAMAREAGLEVVVVDHHEPGPRLPECHLIHRAMGEYPDVGLCGVGLALKVMHALHIE